MSIIPYLGLGLPSTNTTTVEDEDSKQAISSSGHLSLYGAFVWSASIVIRVR